MLAWTPPQPVSPPYPSAFLPAIAFTGDGTALASWGHSRQSAATLGSALAARPPGAARFGAVHRLPAAAIAGGAVGYGARRVAVAASDPIPPARRRVRLTVRLGRAGGTLGTPAFDAVRRDVSRPTLAADARGDLAFAWFENRGVHDDRVYVATRPAGGRFGSPRLIATGQLRNLTVAVGRRGQLLTVWEDFGRLRVRFRGRTQTLRSEPAFTQRLRARVDAGGRAVVAWDAQAVSSGGDIGTGYVEVAVRAAGAARFAAARLLETIPATVPVNGMALAGRRVVWSGWDGAQYAVRSAPIAGGAVAAVPAATGAVRVEGAAGDVAVFTRDPYEDAGTVFAADLSDGSAAQRLSVAPNAREAAVAVDPRTHAPTVVWVDRPDGRDRIEAATPSPSRRRAAAAPPSRGTPAGSR
ncbi:MAG: hypothetical protein QOE86_2953 [Solirubrobacteraceae bacterium]|nr:hypothetical protein [Solirubrobacteraceae bacterium]